MRPRLSPAGIILLVGLGSCSAKQEALPPVPPSQLEVRMPSACPILPPGAPAWREPISRVPDPSSCVGPSVAAMLQRLPADVRRDTLPVTLTLSSRGAVIAVEFRDDCTPWVKYEVDGTTADCIRRAVRRWRYTPDPDTCEKPNYINNDSISLAPSIAGEVVVTTFRRSACG
jgi:hypothetical protein